MKEEILEAKKKLYLLLLQSNSNLLTKNEIDIMFLISKDKQIQKLFKNKKA